MFEISFALTPNTPGKPGVPTMNDLDFCVSHCSTPQLLRSHPRGNSNYSLVKERYISAFAGEPISDSSSLHFALIYQPFYWPQPISPVQGEADNIVWLPVVNPSCEDFLISSTRLNYDPKRSDEPSCSARARGSFIGQTHSTF
jgi:hypothetical protein